MIEKGFAVQGVVILINYGHLRNRGNRLYRRSDRQRAAARRASVIGLARSDESAGRLRLRDIPCIMAIFPCRRAWYPPRARRTA